MTACKSNLRQIWVGIDFYLQDFGDMLPPAGIVEAPHIFDQTWNWARIISDMYLHDRKVLKCPSDTTLSEFSYRYNRGELYSWVTWTSWLNDVAQPASGDSHTSVHYARIRDPTGTILVGEDAHPDKTLDSAAYSAMRAYAATCTVLDDPWGSINPHSSAAYGSDGRMNYLFADGHVQARTFPPDDISRFWFRKRNK